MAYATSDARRSGRPAGSTIRPGGQSAKTGRTVALPAGVPAPRSRGSFLTGLGIGIALGAAVALLLAPQTGAETRRALRRRGRRLRNSAADTWEDLRMELARTKRALRRRRREAAENPEPDDA